MDYTVHGITQARIQEWVAFPFSRDLPNPGIEPRSPALQADALPSETTREAHELVILKLFSMYSRIGQISKYIMGQAFSLLEREGRGSRSVVSDSL